MTDSLPISVHYLTNLDKAHLFLSLYLTNTLLGRLTQWGDLHFKSNSFSLKSWDSVLFFCPSFDIARNCLQKVPLERQILLINVWLSSSLFACRALIFPFQFICIWRYFMRASASRGFLDSCRRRRAFMRDCTRSQFFPAKLLLCSTLLLLGSESFTPASRFTWLGWLINCTFICRHLQEYYGSS